MSFLSSTVVKVNYSSGNFSCLLSSSEHCSLIAASKYGDTERMPSWTWKSSSFGPTINDIMGLVSGLINSVSDHLVWCYYHFSYEQLYLSIEALSAFCLILSFVSLSYFFLTTLTVFPARSLDMNDRLNMADQRGSLAERYLEVDFNSTSNGEETDMGLIQRVTGVGRRVDGLTLLIMRTNMWVLEAVHKSRRPRVLVKRWGIYVFGMTLPPKICGDSLGDIYRLWQAWEKQKGTAKDAGVLNEKVRWYQIWLDTVTCHLGLPDHGMMRNSWMGLNDRSFRSIFRFVTTINCHKAQFEYR